MLLRFSGENFLSFRNDFILSMLATALKEPSVPENGNILFGGEAIGNVLSSAAIYGANASGKSNLVKALKALRELVLQSADNFGKSEEIGAMMFRFNTESISEPIMLEIMFEERGTIFRYGCELLSQLITREWLYSRNNRKKAKEVELFFREDGAITVHASMSITRDIVNRSMIRPNALVLSTAGMFNDPVCNRVINWFKDMTVIQSEDDRELWKAVSTTIDDEPLRKRIVDFARYADFGIDDIQKRGDVVVSSHTVYNNEGQESGAASLPFKQIESDGTVKFFQLSAPVIKALDQGSLLIVDELDARIHPNLTRRIISLFNSPEANPHGAQLLFTLHDATILNEHILRRDQIWFTEKDTFGASRLFPLSDFKVRANAPFVKDYLTGRYGATPVIGSIETIFSGKKEVHK